MVVQCQKCGTKFKLDDTKIGPRGSRVKCSKCQTSFVVNKKANPESQTPVDTSGISNPSFAPPTVVETGMDTSAPFAEVKKTGAFDKDAITIDWTPPLSGTQQQTPSSQDGNKIALDLDSSTPVPTTVQSSQAPLPTAADETSLSLDLETNETAPPLDEGIERFKRHEAETAVYKVPEELRAAALQNIEASSLELDTADSAPLAGNTDPSSEAPLEQLSAVTSQSEATSDLSNIPFAGPETISEDEFTLVDNDQTNNGSESSGSDPFADTEFAASGGLAADGTFTPPEGVPVSETLIEESLSPDMNVDSRLTVTRLQPVIWDGAEPITEESETDVDEPPDSHSLLVPTLSRGRIFFVRFLSSAVGVFVLVLGLMIYFEEGRLDFTVLRRSQTVLHHQTKLKTIAYKSLYPVLDRVFLYTTATSQPLLIVQGKVDNRGKESFENIEVLVEMLDPSTNKAISVSTLAGDTLSPADLIDLTDSASVLQHFRQRVQTQGQVKIAPHSAVDFNAIVFSPPSPTSQQLVKLSVNPGKYFISPSPPSSKHELAAPITGQDEMTSETNKIEKKRVRTKRKGKRKNKRKRRRKSNSELL